MTDLILALDVKERERALNIAAACAPYIDGIKVGYPLVLTAGLAIARDLHPLGLPLIADFKVADIPATNRLICGEVFSAGFDSVIAHGFIGGDAVLACVETAHENGGKCFIVAEMSHPGAVEFIQKVAERIALLAVQCDADGIIAPATRPERIGKLREVVGSKLIYAPGIGVQGGEMGKIAQLVDGVIVGRTIYEAHDPAAAARTLAVIRR